MRTYMCLLGPQYDLRQVWLRICDLADINWGTSQGRKGALCIMHSQQGVLVDIKIELLVVSSYTKMLHIM